MAYQQDPDQPKVEEYKGFQIRPILKAYRKDGEDRVLQLGFEAKGKEAVFIHRQKENLKTRIMRFWEERTKE